jgi:type VI secretion system protein ImpA
MDLAPLLAPIGPDAPSGPNLKLTNAYVEFERLTREKPAQYNGKTLIAAAEEPPWREVVKHASTLLLQSKDLRIAFALLRASVHTNGWEGLFNGLSLMRQLLEEFWDDIHPQLDPEDEDSAILRINVLAELAQEDVLLSPLRRLPIVNAPRAGRYSLRDITMVASGTPAAAGDSKPLDPATIQAAFMEAKLDELSKTLNAIDGSRAEAARIEAFVGEKLGVGQSVNLSRLTRLLNDGSKLLTDKIAQRAPANDHPNGEAAMSDSSVSDQAFNGHVASAPGQIRTRDDVVRVLDAVCEYYRAKEPSSPVPILLVRAKNLVPKGFMEIIEDLVPDGMSQLQVIRGKVEGEGAE